MPCDVLQFRPSYAVFFLDFCFSGVEGGKMGMERKSVLFSRVVAVWEGGAPSACVAGYE